MLHADSNSSLQWVRGVWRRWCEQREEEHFLLHLKLALGMTWRAKETFLCLSCLLCLEEIDVGIYLSIKNEMKPDSHTHTAVVLDLCCFDPAEQ